MSSATEYADPTVVDTRYKRAKQEWDHRMGDSLVRARNWRFVAVGALIVLAFSIAGLIYLGTQPKSVPYVIEVDRLGEASFHGEIGREAVHFKPSEKHLQYQLRQFVQAVRSVSSDPKVTEKVWGEAVDMCSAQCGRMLDSYVKEGGGNPMARMLKEHVTVDVTAVVQITDGSWQVDWRERFWATNGTADHEELWRGIFTVKIRPPTTIEQMRKNPLGVFVDEFHWDEVSR